MEKIVRIIENNLMVKAQKNHYKKMEIELWCEYKGQKVDINFSQDYDVYLFEIILYSKWGRPFQRVLAAHKIIESKVFIEEEIRRIKERVDDDNALRELTKGNRIRQEEVPQSWQYVYVKVSDKSDKK